MLPQSTASPAVAVKCSIEDCDRPRDSRGWCNKHYQRWVKYGDPLTIWQLKGMAHCTAPDCTRKRVYGVNLCRMHKARWYRHGDFGAPAQARGTFEQRFWNKVDTSGECWLWKGKPAPNGYGQIIGPEGVLGAHRASWIINRGPIPAGMLICHRCDVPMCVRPDHLFLGTIADNNLDMTRKGRHWRAKARQLTPLLSAGGSVGGDSTLPRR